VSDTATAAPTAEGVLRYLLSELVDDVDAIEISTEDRDGRLRFNVGVGPGDMGRVIGKRGRVANAIRTVVRAAAVRDGAEVEVEFLD
jgi:predicted RNA-binding protein YlqC (UPF0109 family)